MIEIEFIARQAQKGDRQAFQRLIASVHDDLFRLALTTTGNHHDAEDALQDAYIKAYKGLATFRFDADPRSWLYRITLNCCHDLRRRRRGGVVSLTPSETDQNPIDPPDHNPAGDPDRQLNAEQVRSLFTASLDRLSPLERSVFVLRHQSQLAIRDIATTLQRAEGTVKNILFRAVRKVRAYLRDHDVVPEEVDHD